jgi:hypothetical protein
MLSDNQTQQLERLVEAVGLAEVLLALEKMCYAKASSIAWHDKETAAAWNRAGTTLHRCASSKTIREAMDLTS